MQILRFIKWHIKNIEFWQILWMIGVATTTYGITNENTNIATIGAFCLFAIPAKYLFWDTVRDSYKRFKDEQNKLFTTIKDSHK